MTDTIQEGAEVWFDRGHGPEYGTVWAVENGHAAVGIGEHPVTGAALERRVFPVEKLHDNSAAAAHAAAQTAGD